MRVALITTTGWSTKVKPLLPTNYQVIGRGMGQGGQLIIAGYDEDDATLEGIITHLRANMIGCREIVISNSARDPHARELL